MSDSKTPPVDCSCKIPVCLEFTHASATEEFKTEMKAIFSEIFADLCGDNDDDKTAKSKAK